MNVVPGAGSKGDLEVFRSPFRLGFDGPDRARGPQHLWSRRLVFNRCVAWAGQVNRGGLSDLQIPLAGIWFSLR